MENTMKYIAYKLKFSTGVHFGNGSLDNTEYTFCADTLFSALCIEAVKHSEDKLSRHQTLKVLVSSSKHKLNSVKLVNF